MYAYMAALGRMMAGSGFEELLIEARLCVIGSITQIMNGKHFNRAMSVHHHMLDAVNWLTLDAFLENYDSLTVCPDELKALADKPSNETLHTVLNADADFGMWAQGVLLPTRGDLGRGQCHGTKF